MAPIFTFFVDKTESSRCAPFIKKLEKYYPSFADGVYISPPDMKKKYARANMKFFAYDFDDLIMFDLDAVNEIEPLLALSMDSTTRMNTESWMVVYRFLKAVFSDQEIDLTEMQKLVPVPVKLSEKPQLLKSTPPLNEPNKEYGFDYLVEDNIAYCQVIKPFTDLPYTAVIRNFSEVGFEPLFTALYVSQSWGVCNLDYAFLVNLWTHLNMQGDLNLEKRLAAEIQLCQQGKPEPELYRLDISGVKEQLSRKQKRRDFENYNQAKFVKE